MVGATMRSAAGPKGLLVAGMLPLRLFLGGTNLYAGLSKLSDPQFFDPGAPGSIGRQLQGYAQGGSPLAPLLTSIGIPHASLFGALIALGEVCVGLAVLAGVLGRTAAFGGLLISLTLYLTASWDVHPYFLGNDLPYAAGWLTLLLAGLGPYQLDQAFSLRARSPLTSGTGATRGQGRATGPVAAELSSRADFIRRLGCAGAVIALGGLLGGVARWRAVAGAPARGRVASVVAASSDVAPPADSTAAMPPNSARPFTAPGSGDPALLIRLADGHLVAYDVRCTHQGCPVQYDPRRKVLACPCHGSVFDPANGGRVLQGPATRPLPPIALGANAGQAPAEVPGELLGA